MFLFFLEKSENGFYSKVDFSKPSEHYCIHLVVILSCNVVISVFRQSLDFPPSYVTGCTICSETFSFHCKTASISKVVKKGM